MNVLKKSLLGLLLCLGITANASATTTSIVGNVVTGSFTKTYDFSVPAGNVYSLTGTVISFVDTINGNLTGFLVDQVLLNNTPLALSSSSNTDTVDINWFSTVTTSTFSSNTLSAGLYTLTLTGFAYTESALNGSFTVSQIATPVPESSTFSMLIVGWASALFLIMTRRRQA